MNRQWLLMLLVAVFAAGGGYFFASQTGPTPAIPAVGPMQAAAAPDSKDLVGKERPDFSLEDIDGQPIEASDFNGQVLLLNFWATWCKPCVEEMPMLSGLGQELSARGLRIVGVAIDDPQKARNFAAEMDLSYPVTAGGVEATLTGRRYGNRDGMLPYSVLVDRSGTVRWTHLGALKRDDLLEALMPLL